MLVSNFLLLLTFILLGVLSYGIYMAWGSYIGLKRMICDLAREIQKYENIMAILEKVFLEIGTDIHELSHDIQQVKTSQRASKKRELKGLKSQKVILVHTKPKKFKK